LLCPHMGEGTGGQRGKFPLSGLFIKAERSWLNQLLKAIPCNTVMWRLNFNMNLEDISSQIITACIQFKDFLGCIGKMSFRKWVLIFANMIGPNSKSAWL
jgi:hypothetical protein